MTVITKALERVLMVEQRRFSEHRSVPVTGAAAAVLKNNVLVGCMNANKRHWYRAAENRARADRTWLSRLIGCRETPGNFKQALERQPDDIKVAIQFAGIGGKLRITKLRWSAARDTLGPERITDERQLARMVRRIEEALTKSKKPA